MTQVDFYILPDQHTGAREAFACRVIEKAYQKGHYVYVHTESTEQARHMDEILWTFRDGSFVPHFRTAEAGETNTPVLIGHQGEPPLEADVLVNLAQDVPLFFSRFLRVAEIIGEDEEQKRHGRERFRFYRDRGYPLNSHKIESGSAA